MKARQKQDKTGMRGTRPGNPGMRGTRPGNQAGEPARSLYVKKEGAGHKYRQNCFLEPGPDMPVCQTPHRGRFWAFARSARLLENSGREKPSLATGLIDK